MTKPYILVVSTKDREWNPKENVEWSIEEIQRNDGARQWFIILKAPDDAEFIVADKPWEH